MSVPAPPATCPAGLGPAGRENSRPPTPSGVFNPTLDFDAAAAAAAAAGGVPVVPSSPHFAPSDLRLDEDLRTPEINRLTRAFLEAAASSTPAPLLPACSSSMLHELVRLSTHELARDINPLELELLGGLDKPVTEAFPLVLPELDLVVPMAEDSAVVAAAVAAASSPASASTSHAAAALSSSPSSPAWAPSSPSSHDSEPEYAPPSRSARRSAAARRRPKAAAADGLTASGQVRKRAPKQFVPDEKKDAKYWERRRKNNEAARRNRERKRQEEHERKTEVNVLDSRKHELEDEVTLLRRELAVLRKAVRERFMQVCM